MSEWKEITAYDDEDNDQDELETETARFEEPGDMVEGEVKAINEDQFNEGKYSYLIKTGDGKGKWVNARPVQLHQKMSSVDVGHEVRIKFEGLEETDKPNDMKVFTVMTKMPEVTE